MKRFLDEWTKQSIAIPGEGHFACSTFAVKKPGKYEPCCYTPPYKVGYVHWIVLPYMTGEAYAT